MSFVNRMVDKIADSLAGSDVIDSYFIMSDLKEINLTQEERTQTAFFDSQANDSKRQDNDPRPIGKQVY